MTYLEICKSVRILAGAQGSGPTSVEDGDLGGYEVNLVHFVDTAYIDIQSSRDNFKFMRDDAQWGLVISQDVYDTAFIPDDIKKIDNIRIRKSNGKWNSPSLMRIQMENLSTSLEYLAQVILNSTHPLVRHC